MKLIGQLNFQGETYKVTFNPAQKTASLSPLPSAVQLKDYYEKHHQKLNDQINLHRENQRLDSIEVFQPSGKLLDIGAGRGYFLTAVQSRTHWQGTGLEISPTACQYAKKNFNLKILNTPLEAAKLKNNSFDVITFHAVLEHLRHPFKNLKIAQQKLKPHGLVVVRIPNIRSFEFYFSKLLKRNYAGFIFDHLHYFTPEGISLLLKKAGFKTLKITSRHYTPSEELRKHPYWLITNLAKRFLEGSNLGGSLCFGNTLYVYARKI